MNKHKQYKQPKNLKCKFIPNHVKIPFIAGGPDAGESIESVKNRLNAEKSKLDEYYEDPSLRKTLTAKSAQLDLYRGMRDKIAKIAPNVSNAWMKYWELYSDFDLITTTRATPTNFAFFNAEFPGSALCAYIFWCKTHNITCDWRASSYIGDGGSGDGPATTTMLGDVYGLYKNNRDKWLMGVGVPGSPTYHNGDMTSIANINIVAQQLGRNVDFYSHDAGIDTSSDFNNQESLNLKLHLGCALCGFKVMRVGANFVAKQYTFFEPISRELIVIYSTLFREFYISKPLTSRPTNSEIYLVGVGFLGLDARTESRLEGVMNAIGVGGGTTNTTIRPDPAFDAVFARAARTIFGKQTELLAENRALMSKYSVQQLRDGLSKLADERQNAWLQKYLPQLVH